MTRQASIEELAPSEADGILSPEVFVEKLHSDALQLISDMHVQCILYLSERKELHVQGFFFQPLTIWLHFFFTEDFSNLKGTRDVVI